MKTTLRSPVPLTRVTMMAEVGVAALRPELRLLCAAAVDNQLTSEVIDKVLPGLTDAARANLLRYCRNLLRLVDQDGRLTVDGKRCAATGRVLVPEQGCYVVHVAHPPIGRSQVLHFVRQSPYANEEPARMDVVPDWMPVGRDISFESVVDHTEFAVLRALTGRRCVVEDLEPWQFRWDLDFESGRNAWWLEGRILEKNAGAARYCTRQATITDLDLAQLFADWEPRWQRDRRLVQVPFDATLASQFRRDMTYPCVAVPNVGSFPNVNVEDVPVGPSDDIEARRWSTALLLQRIEVETGYVVPERLATFLAEAVENTPLAGFHIAPPRVEELLARFDNQRSSHTYWLLAAPSDLRPAEVSP